MTTNTDLAVTIPPDVIRNAGEPVFPELRRRLHPSPKLAALIDAREAYGITKYGQTLLTDDSRDTATEIANELLDTMAYAMKWLMQHRSHPSTYVRHSIENVLIDAHQLLSDVVDLDEFMKYKAVHE